MADQTEIFLLELSASNGAQTISKRRAFGIASAKEAEIIGRHPDAAAAISVFANNVKIVDDRDRFESRLASLFAGPSPALTEITRLFDTWSQLGVVELVGIDHAGQPIARFELRRMGQPGVLDSFGQIGRAIGAAQQLVMQEQQIDPLTASSTPSADAQISNEQFVQNDQKPDHDEPPPEPSRGSEPRRAKPR